MPSNEPTRVVFVTSHEKVDIDLLRAAAEGVTQLDIHDNIRSLGYMVFGDKLSEVLTVVRIKDSDVQNDASAHDLAYPRRRDYQQPKSYGPPRRKRW
jgi:hypothetical protein